MDHVIEINDVDQLRPLRGVWNRLLLETGQASFFQSLPWLEAYWRRYGRGQRLRVLVVGDREPVGILPLTVIRERTRAGWIRTLTYPLHDWGTRFGPIGPDPAATLAAGLKHLQRTRQDWDMLDLRWISAGAQLLSATVHAMRSAGFNASTGVWARTALVDLQGDWESYFASRTGKFRNNVRRQEQKLARLGDVTYLRYRPGGAAEGDGQPWLHLYNRCVELARRSWQGNSTTGTTLSHEAVADFLRQTHILAAQAGAADINLLEVNGTPAAFAYNYCWNGYVFGLRAGYDPVFAQAGAGTVLIAHMLRDSFERKDHTFDLGTGYLEGKRHWLTRIADCCRATHYPVSKPRVQLLRVKHWLKQSVGAAAS
ncbi:MAG: GNAT family N-acetyltransferase [Rhodopirellula sp.]|nr:GNAT family N-acetyltransferase [Rhodopirellula sp.]